MHESYGPPERVRDKKDFNKLYKKGVCVRSKYFNIIYLPNDLGHSRMAVVASRKVGNAVDRNRIRRRAKDLFRRNKERLAFSMDMLFIAKKDLLSITWAEMRERYFEALESICGGR